MERRAHIFVAVLGASNYTYAEARWSEALPEWIGAHVNAFTAIGGVPGAVVCDNLKAGVTATCRYEPGINRTYQDLATHYDTAILPTRPRKPRDKAKVEVGVLIIERYVLARLRNRRFFSLFELNAAIREIVADLNARDHAQARRQPARAARDDRAAGTEGAAERALSVCRMEEVPGRARLSRRDRAPLLLGALAPDPRAGRGAHHRHARSRSSTRAAGSRAMRARTCAIATRRFASTCRARIGVTPSGRRRG